MPESQERRDRDNDRPSTPVLRSIEKHLEESNFVLNRILDRMERIENRLTCVETKLKTWASPEAVAGVVEETGIKPAIENLATAAEQPPPAGP